MSRPRPSYRAGGDASLVRHAYLRIGLQAAVSTVLVIVMLTAVAVLVVVRSEDGANEQLLVETVARADDVEDPPSNMWLVIRDATGTHSTAGIPSGVTVTADLDRVAAGGGVAVSDVTVDGHDYRLRTEPRFIPAMGPTTVQAVLDLRPGQAQQELLLRALLIGGLVGLLVAAPAGTLLARRAVRPLEAALALQRRFVADAGHELRTPLTLLSTRAQLLRRTGPDAPDDGVGIDGVVRDTERLAAILDDLLLAADPRTTADATTVDLTAIVAEVTAAVAPSAQAAHVAITTSGVAASVEVPGSAVAVHRALTALAHNALRHATAEVRIAVSTAPGRAVIEVGDDGPGIEDTMMPRLFERFASAADPLDAGPRRYGIGLALVSEIVERHGGTVSVANKPDGGAQFRIELPDGSRRRR